ncbi:MAG: type II secretion system GspH family protein, partial [Puniceicoccales bacterium]|nr:type II secretion system GspH family protein [Puniceicoccales bacterium]
MIPNLNNKHRENYTAIAINRRNQKSFTLIELLVIACIIGILLSTILPIISKTILDSRKAAIANSTRQILLAYKDHIAQTNRPITEADIDTFLASKKLPKNANAWIAYLVWQKHLSNNPKLCLASYDYMLKEVLKHDTSTKMPIKIIDNHGIMDENFATIPTCFVVCMNMAVDAPDSTPIIWTRGLGTNGKWHGPQGNYHSRYARNLPHNNGNFFGQNQGGLLGFADGRVEWNNKLMDEDGNGKIFEYNQTTRTTNIIKALPSDVVVASW